MQQGTATYVDDCRHRSTVLPYASIKAGPWYGARPAQDEISGLLVCLLLAGRYTPVSNQKVGVHCRCLQVSRTLTVLSSEAEAKVLVSLGLNTTW